MESLEPSPSRSETIEIPPIDCAEGLPGNHVSRVLVTQLHEQSSAQRPMHLCRTQEDIQEGKQLFWKKKDKLFSSFLPTSTDINSASLNPSLNSDIDCCRPCFIEENTSFSNEVEPKCQGKDDWDRSGVEWDSDSGMDGCNNYPNHCESAGCCNSKRATLEQGTKVWKLVYSSLSSTKYRSSSGSISDQNCHGSEHREDQIRSKDSGEGSEEGENRSNRAEIRNREIKTNDFGDRKNRHYVTVINIGGKIEETAHEAYPCYNCSGERKINSKINRKLFDERKLKRSNDSLFSSKGPPNRNSHHYVKNSDPAQKSWFLTNIEFAGSARESAMEQGKGVESANTILPKASETANNSCESTASGKMKRDSRLLVSLSSEVKVQDYTEPDSQECPNQFHILNNWERAELMQSFLEGSPKSFKLKPTLTRSHSLNSPLGQFDRSANSEILHSDKNSTKINSKTNSLDLHKTSQISHHYSDLAKVLADRLRSFKPDEKLEKSRQLEQYIRHHTNSTIHTQQRKSGRLLYNPVCLSYFVFLYGLYLFVFYLLFLHPFLPDSVYISVFKIIII